jgi:hypothetical protein
MTIAAMSKIIDGLPEGLTLEGFRSNNPHSQWSRDETVLSPDGQRFAAAFDITEVTMMNEMGGVVWGRSRNGIPEIVGHLPAWSICCWSRPFCAWITPDIFVVKLADKQRRWPLLAIHIKLGFQIVGVSGLESRPSDISPDDVPETGWFSAAPVG